MWPLFWWDFDMSDLGHPKKSHKPKILLADDEWTVVELLSRYLAENGYEVTSASDGGEAWDLFQKQSFDLVLSDLRMPGFDGLQLLNAVKDVNPRIPVVLISGFGDVETVVKALKSGAENFLAKPLDLNELEKVLEQSLALACVRPGGSQIQGDIEQNTRIETRSLLGNISDIVYQISLSAVAVGFSQYDLDNNIKMALVEALTNAMEHGNGWEESKLVRISARLTRHVLQVTIEDEGIGFDHQNLTDPTVQENLLSERGRGIFLLRAIMDEVRFNEPGNAVTLLKQRRHKSAQSG
jgi:CheY-like chemotaxis protein